MITLTSFVELRKMPLHKFSAARWAPNFAKAWLTVPWAAPFYEDGSAIKLRDFGDDPLPKYEAALLEIYRGKWDEIREWLGERATRDYGMACWCPNTKTATRQLAEFATFHCHLGVVGKVLTSVDLEWQFGPAHDERMKI